MNQFLVDSHFREKTVILFTHRHSFDAFREALPGSLVVTESATLKRHTGASVLDKLSGDSPWGLADVVVIRPAATARGQGP